MPSPTLQLDQVNWGAVATAIRDPGETAPHVLADALSLSALFATDFHQGLIAIIRAREYEPLNLVHTVRHVLFLMRFGASTQAQDLAHSLQQQLPGVALPAYLRAMATHRQEEYKRSANAAAEVVAAYPAFFQARFLQAESQLHSQFKGLRKLVLGLPRGESHAAAWLDLTAKLVLAGSHEGNALAAELAADPTQLPPGSRELALADWLLELNNAGIDVLEAKLAGVRAGSRAEEVVLLFLNDRLDENRTSATAVAALSRLVARFPDRAAVRMVYVARLTRRAVELASQEKYTEALRMVERCLRLEPHETIHYQNRAALFTLLREADAYHDAWFELDRARYRHALLGGLTTAGAVALAKSHRLFAQQARLITGETAFAGSRQNTGFLMETTRTRDGASETILAVNNDHIDDDPELFRQWTHHRRAELIFSHWALGTSPRRFLLDPENRPEARERLAGLVACTRSLAVLVPEEGALLASRIVHAWQCWAGKMGPAYTSPPADADVRALERLHLETLGDLAFLCLTWKPDGRRIGLVEDVLAFLRDEAPFFDDSQLLEAIQGRQSEASYPLKLLGGFINESLGLDASRSSPLDRKQNATVIGRLAAELLIRFAYRMYEEQRGTALGAENALAYIERARGHDPENVRTELSYARFLLLASHDDLARATLARLERSARAREPEVHSEIEDLRQILSDRAKSGVTSRPRLAVVPATAPEPPAGPLKADLESEVDRFPSSIQAYEELARKLAAAGQIQGAVNWSERAMTQCLSRDGQVRARSLNIEMLGLAKLGERDRDAVRLYITGAHRPALDLLEAPPDSNPPDYTLDFLLGRCRLALGRPEEAQQAFERALEHCGRQLHRTVLRGLAMDVDQTYLVVARSSIAVRMGAGDYERAIREAWVMLGHLRHPESALVELARVHLDAAVAGMGSAQDALPAPSGPELELCGGRLADVYATGSDLERARRLARLSLATHEPSRRLAELILRKADVLEEQTALALALARSGDLLRQGNFPLALAALDGAGAAEPRVVRQRALLLLKLERFAEAEAAGESLRGSPSSVAREFLESFPALVFRQRIAAASRLLRAGESAAALEILAAAVPTNGDEAVEMACCVGFCLTMDAYRLRRGGDNPGATARFTTAMDTVEPFVAAARASKHTRLIELYETLDKELDH